MSVKDTTEWRMSVNDRVSLLCISVNNYRLCLHVAEGWPALNVFTYFLLYFRCQTTVLRRGLQSVKSYKLYSLLWWYQSRINRYVLLSNVGDQTWISQNCRAHYAWQFDTALLQLWPVWWLSLTRGPSSFWSFLADSMQCCLFPENILTLLVCSNYHGLGNLPRVC